MRVRFTPDALVELDEILAQLAEHSPQGAERVGDRISAVLERLLSNPRSGPPTSRPGLRRIGTRPYSYIVFYELREDDLVIIAVRHGARDPSSMPDALS